MGAESRLTAEVGGRQLGTTEATPDRAKELRAKGLSAEEIAKSMGVSRNTVFVYMRKSKT
jgi:orotate phosphoribosyltransferase-like protein